MSVVLAPACAACGELLEQPTAGPVCDACWHLIRSTPSPLAARPGGHIQLVAAIGDHEGALRAVIHALKYEGRRSLARPLARLMRGCGADALAGAEAAVPVPLHPSRRRARGFNQAMDLARHLNLPVRELLQRTRATSTQTDLSAAERRLNMRGAFGLRKKAKNAGILPGIVVLVDDVCTTGATLEACAVVLIDAGVREVRALTAARVAAPPR